MVLYSVFTVSKGALVLYSVFKGVLILYSVFKGVLVIFGVFQGRFELGLVPRRSRGAGGVQGVQARAGEQLAERQRDYQPRGGRAQRGARPAAQRRSAELAYLLQKITKTPLKYTKNYQNALKILQKLQKRP